MWGSMWGFKLGSSSWGGKVGDSREGVQGGRFKIGIHILKSQFKYFYIIVMSLFYSPESSGDSHCLAHAKPGLLPNAGFIETAVRRVTGCPMLELQQPWYGV